jgi:Arc/MetJ family transcription regulator
MTRTNVVLDENLIAKAMKITGAATRRMVIEIALRRLVEEGEAYARIMTLGGKLPWVGDVNEMRAGRKCT